MTNDDTDEPELPQIVANYLNSNFDPAELPVVMDAVFEQMSTDDQYEWLESLPSLMRAELSARWEDAEYDDDDDEDGDAEEGGDD